MTKNYYTEKDRKMKIDITMGQAANLAHTDFKGLGLGQTELGKRMKIRAKFYYKLLRELKEEATIFEDTYDEKNELERLDEIAEIAGEGKK